MNNVNIQPSQTQPTSLQLSRRELSAGSIATRTEGAFRNADKSIHLGELIRKYWLMLLLLVLLGAVGGGASVLLTSPMYRAHLLLEVRNIPIVSTVPGNSAAGFSSEDTQINIQTQINILRSGTFLKRGAERMQAESVPLAPTGQDFLSRLRQRVRPTTQDPMESAKEGLNVALESFNARPVAQTRLIELSCDSTNPDVAAQFLNSMAAEFVQDNAQGRMQTSQRTGEWLDAQIEETKSRIDQAEARLRDFVQASGNRFAGQETTLDDTKLAQLKLDLAKAQADRIAKQTRYELTLHNPPEALAEVLSDSALRAYQQQLSSLREQKAALEVTLTPKNDKIQKINAQIAIIEKAYKDAVTNTVDVIRNDYQAAERQEMLLSAAYAGQSQAVGSETAKTFQYEALKRELETLRQMYQSLLIQKNQVGLGSSAPENPIRIVEASERPDQPYKPLPVLNVSFGCILGLVFAGGLIFIREKIDRRITSPGTTRLLLHSQELGVIPSWDHLPVSDRKLSPVRRLPRGKTITLPISGNVAEQNNCLTVWQNMSPYITESFRSTLASILKQTEQCTPRTILVTSARPSEGKTTVVRNLGLTLAESGRKVLLVDADFRRPRLHHEFEISNELSLFDLLSANEETWLAHQSNGCGVVTVCPGLSVLPNRPTKDGLFRALYSARLPEMLNLLKPRYDMVLIDAPPVLDLADARVVARFSDAVILVLRSGHTDQQSAIEAHRCIHEDGLYLLGTVLTGWDPKSARKRQYYYYEDVKSVAD
jgi:polysaccharide biosynthesis transport protein